MNSYKWDEYTLIIQSSRIWNILNNIDENELSFEEKFVKNALSCVTDKTCSYYCSIPEQKLILIRLIIRGDKLCKSREYGS